jgi:hypothetical protein
MPQTEYYPLLKAIDTKQVELKTQRLTSHLVLCGPMLKSIGRLTYVSLILGILK